jgi:hypothetical protein
LYEKGDFKGRNIMRIMPILILNPLKLSLFDVIGENSKMGISLNISDFQ